MNKKFGSLQPLLLLFSYCGGGGKQLFGLEDPDSVLLGLLLRLHLYQACQKQPYATYIQSNVPPVAGPRPGAR